MYHTAFTLLSHFPEYYSVINTYRSLTRLKVFSNLSLMSLRRKKNLSFWNCFNHICKYHTHLCIHCITRTLQLYKLFWFRSFSSLWATIPDSNRIFSTCKLPMNVPNTVMLFSNCYCHFWKSEGKKTFPLKGTIAWKECVRKKFSCALLGSSDWCKN